MLQKISKNKKYQGFSFIEAILSIFLISTGMIAVMGLMSGSLKESISSRDQIIGALLSQEGIELVRNLRDNNWAKEYDTFKDFPSGINSGLVDYDDNSISNSSDYFLYKNTSGYLSHGSGSGVVTKFKRLIVVFPYGTGNLTANSDLVEIRSVVTWNGANPDSNPSPEACNSSSKCAYTQTILSRWGGM